MDTINERAFWAEVHQDVRGDQPHIFSIKYVKKDATVGFKACVSKSRKQLPGKQKYRGNINLNRILLLYDHEAERHFEIVTDLITQYNGMKIVRNY